MTLEINNNPTLHESPPTANTTLQSCLKITSIALFIICAGVGIGLLICTATNLLPAPCGYYVGAGLLVIGVSVPFILRYDCHHQNETKNMTKAAAHSSPAAVKASLDPVEKPASIEVLEHPLASDTPLDNTWDLRWDSFCSFTQPVQLQIDQQNIEGIDPREILSWVPQKDSKKHKIISKKITDIEKCQNLANVPRWMPNIIGDRAVQAIVSETNPEKTFERPNEIYKDMQSYLREIVRQVREIETSSSLEEASKFKQHIVKELSAAFKQCIPTWNRTLNDLCLQVTLRQGVSQDYAYLENIIAWVIMSYKEQVILDGRQLSSSVKNQEWHYLTYVSTRIGNVIGITTPSDFLYTMHKYHLEQKSDEDLVEWFKGLCSAEGLVEYFLLQICSGKIPYKTEEGCYMFASYINHNNLLPDNVEIEQCYDEQFVPTRLAIALILQHLGGLDRLP